MIRRLLLMLLVACLAVPAAAMPLHCAPTPELQPAEHHATDHGDSGHGHKMIPENSTGWHGCIGCIAPVAGVGAVPQSIGHTPAQPVGAEIKRLARLAMSPELPPPRS